MPPSLTRARDGSRERSSEPGLEEGDNQAVAERNIVVLAMAAAARQSAVDALNTLRRLRIQA
jgi:hypothetical protein